MEILIEEEDSPGNNQPCHISGDDSHARLQMYLKIPLAATGEESETSVRAANMSK